MSRIQLTVIWFLLVLSQTVTKGSRSLATDTTCTLPETPENGIIPQMKNVKYNAVPHRFKIAYSCNYGFRLVGTSWNRCVRGRWRFDAPQCKDIKCSDPGTPEKGWRHGSTFEVGSKVSYACFAGYTLLGSFERYCLPNGQWSGELTRCNSESNYCPDPGVPINGMKTGNIYDEGSTVYFQCYPGFNLIGSKSRVCQQDRSWTGREPKCQGLDDFDSNEDLFKRLKAALKTTAEFQKFQPAESPVLPGLPVRPVLSGFPEPPERPEILGFPEPPGLPERPELGAFPGLPELPSLHEELEIRFPGIKGERSEVPEFPSLPGLPVLSGFPGLPERPGLPGFPGPPELPRLPEVKGERSEKPDFFEIRFPGLPGFPGPPELPRLPKEKGERSEEPDFFEIRFPEVPAFPSLPGLPGFPGLPERPGRPGLPEHPKLPGFPGAPGPAEVPGFPGIPDLLDPHVPPRFPGLPGLPSLPPLPPPHGFPGRFALPDKISNEYPFKKPDDPRRVITYFVFDSSGSVGSDNFRMCIDFAKALVKQVKMSRNGNRAGALSFSSKANIHFMPHELIDTKDVVKALTRINFSNGGTSITNALETVLYSMIPLTVENLGKNTKSIVFIFTDGKPNMGGDPKLAADELKTAGIEIYCIGITGSTRKNILYKIASEPYEKHVFILNNYDQMSWLIQEITTETIDYSHCGLGLDGVANQYAQVTGSDSARNAPQPWPWMAALYFADNIYDTPTEIKCGGSIIDQQWILTAAHCLLNKKDENKMRDLRTFIIKLGVTNVKNESTVLKLPAQKLFIHQNYDPETFDYDVALIKLDRLIEYNAHIRPICLPPQDFANDTSLYKDREYALVTGWGYDKKKTSTGKAESRIKNVHHLKELRLTIQPSNRCKQSLRNTTFLFTHRMFCAGSQLNEVDACEGDSGGPMMQSQLNKEEGIVYWVQVGIVSWGIGCQQPNTYGFYTHVHNVRNWITQTINLN